MATAVAGATIQEILTNFANSTTVHGVPRVILSRSHFVRTLWAVICLAACTLFSITMYEVLSRYLSYPTDVTIKVVQMPIPFPAVSFCNMRNLDFTLLNTINRMFLKNDDPIYHMNQTQNTFVAEYMKYLAKLSPIYNQIRTASNASSYMIYFDEVFSTASLAANIPEDVIVNASLQLGEFIVNCRFGGQQCHRRKVFTKFFDQRYFNCFTFRAPDTLENDIGDKNEQFLSYGIESGLSVSLLTGSGMLDRNNESTMIPGVQDSRSSSTFGDGVRIIIHAPDIQPFPLDEGYDVAPGYSASFGITPRRNTRLGAPYGNCTPIDDNFGKYKIGTKDRYYHYRVIACQKRCTQKHVIRECGCYDKSLPEPTSDDGNILEKEEEDGKLESVQPCRRVDDIPASCMYVASQVCFDALNNISKRIDCMRNTRLRVKRSKTLMADCSCYQACDEITYGVSYSISKYLGAGFGSDYSYMDITSHFNETMHEGAKSRGMNMTLLDEDLKYFGVNNREMAMRDFSRINAYIADINIIHTEESPSYSRDQLISDIGGQLGIWIGVSVISISEVIEMILTLIGHFASAKRKKNEKEHEIHAEATDKYDVKDSLDVIDEGEKHVQVLKGGERDMSLSLH